MLGWTYLRCIGSRPDGSAERYFAGVGAVHGYVEPWQMLEVNAGRWWKQVTPAAQGREPYDDEVDDDDLLRCGMRHLVRCVGPVLIVWHRLPDDCPAVIDGPGARPVLAAMRRPQLARRWRELVRDAARRRYRRAGA